MSNPDNDQIGMSDLSSNLTAAAAALRAEDRNNLVNALKEKLQTLAGRHSDVMKTLPPKVRKRVEILRELQGHYDELEAKFFEERAALEDKYDKLYEPLYSKRYEIVNAVIEVDGVTETSKDEEGDKDGEEKGVPNFWLNALKTNEIVGVEIFKRDEEALKYLKDIKRSRIPHPKGSFKLEFFFDTNPFFKNSVLTKTYNMADDDEPILDKAIGTQIEWHHGKCLTSKILKKKPRKGSKNTKPITKVEKCESFFNFFNPPQMSDDDEWDIETAEDLQIMVEGDYDIGVTIRDKIIPNAVSWFTGAAAQDDTYNDKDGVDSDDDHEEEDDEDNELQDMKSE